VGRFRSGRTEISSQGSPLPFLKECPAHDVEDKLSLWRSGPNLGFKSPSLDGQLKYTPPAFKPDKITPPLRQLFSGPSSR
jgi:hypothetical protein